MDRDSGDDMQRDSLGDFARRAAVVAMVALLAGALGLLVWFARHGVLVLFAAVLLAVLLDGLTRYVVRWARLPRGIALAGTILGLALVVVGVLLLGGIRVANQAPELRKGLEDSFSHIERQLHRMGLHPATAQLSPAAQGLLPGPSRVFSHLDQYLSTSVELAADLLVIGVAGIYFAVRPGFYVATAIRLAPPTRRERLREVCGELGNALRRWLAGRFVSMLAVGVLTTVGLLVLQVKLALLLGFLAGALTFVPYLGSLISLVPAVLIALLSGPMVAVYVVLLYLGAHILEGYVLTPLIQQRAVRVAPAWLISAQLLGGLIAGVLGILLATPMVVALTVAVQMLYLEDVLGERVRVLGE